MNIESALADVCILNNIFEKAGGSMALRPFVLESDGSSYGVTFLGQPLWDWENDERYDDDSSASPDGKEPLMQFLLRESNKLLENIPKKIRIPTKIIKH